jgi:hypothetical protein
MRRVVIFKKEIQKLNSWQIDVVRLKSMLISVVLTSTKTNGVVKE